MEKEKKTYYYTELSKECVSFISDACAIAASFKVGNLDVLEQHLRKAYLERHGYSMPDEVFDQVKNLLSVLQRQVWDTTYGNKNVIHKISPDADVFFDIKEVCDYQLALDNGDANPSLYPMHWNDEVSQPRFYARKETTYERKKSLALFVQEQKCGHRR